MENNYNKNWVEEEVEKTLSSWDDLERIEANPYFFTRLQQRLANEQSPKQLWSASFLRPALLGILLIINVWTVASVLNSQARYNTTTTATLSDFASDYGLEYNPTDEYLSVE